MNFLNPLSLTAHNWLIELCTRLYVKVTASSNASDLYFSFYKTESYVNLIGLIKLYYLYIYNDLCGLCDNFNIELFNNKCI